MACNVSKLAPIVPKIIISPSPKTSFFKMLSKNIFIKLIKPINSNELIIQSYKDWYCVAMAKKNTRKFNTLGISSKIQSINAKQ